MTVAAIVGDLFERWPELRPRRSDGCILDWWESRHCWTWGVESEDGMGRAFVADCFDDDARAAITDALTEAMQSNDRLGRISGKWHYWKNGADGNVPVAADPDRLTCIVAAIRAAKEKP